MSQAKKLRKMLAEPGIIRAPGAYDAWSARLIEKAGFPAVYMTGYGLSASLIGRPDIGLLSLTEMAGEGKNIAAAVDIPVIADADNGYGGLLNVVRTVQEYERAGLAAIQLEDQVMPKRCGHMEGKQIIPKEEMAAKIRAACYARKDPDTVLIARTDARAVIDFDEALARAALYAEAGADVLFVEAPQSVEELQTIANTIHKPLLANMVEHGKTPMLTGKELEAIGFKIVIYPVTTLYTVTQAMMDMLKKVKQDDTSKHDTKHMVAFPDFNEMIGLDAIRELERSFMK